MPATALTRSTTPGEGIKHRFTRPYRPQTNGKVERFNRTLMSEWAYARPYLSEANREEVYEQFLHYYNHCELTPLSEV